MSTSFAELVVKTIAGVRDALGARIGAVERRLDALEGRPAAGNPPTPEKAVPMWRAQRTYRRGNRVMRADGSFWTCEATRTTAEPGYGDAWQQIDRLDPR